MAVEDGAGWDPVEAALLRCVETGSLQPMHDSPVASALASAQPLAASTWPEQAARALEDCFVESVIPRFRRGIQEARTSSPSQSHAALLRSLAPIARARCAALGALLWLLRSLGAEIPDSLARLAGPHRAGIMASEAEPGRSSEPSTGLRDQAEAAAVTKVARLSMRLDAMTVNAALAEDLSGLLLQYANQRLRHFTKLMTRRQNAPPTAKPSPLIAELLPYLDSPTLASSTDMVCTEGAGTTNAPSVAARPIGIQGQHADQVDASAWRPFWVQHSEHAWNFFEDDEDEEEEEEEEGDGGEEEGEGEAEGSDAMSLGPESMGDHENLDPGREGFRKPGEVRTPVKGEKGLGGGRDEPVKRLDESTLMETSFVEKATSGLQHTLERRLGPVGSANVLDQMGMSWVLETWVASKTLGLVGLGELFSFRYAASVLVSLRGVVQRVCEGQMDRRALQKAQLWNKALLLPFLSLVHPTAHPAAHQTAHHSVDQMDTEEATHLQYLQDWRLRLEVFASKAVLRVRAGQLFAIVLDFPDSQPAVEDLRECVEATGDKQLVVAAYSEALSARLLTAGASTADILQQYVSTIRALRTLDPSGIILEAVSEPIRQYLRTRKDTIRCIMTMLTEEPAPNAASADPSLGLGPLGTPMCLLEEAAAAASCELALHADWQPLGEAHELSADEAQAALEAAELWEPDSVEADPGALSRQRRTMDIVRLLVAIFGTQELFVAEYRVMLAERLLTSAGYDTDKEVRTLELLKLRFGEQPLHACEVMLKDMAESKRIDSNIRKAILAERQARQREQQTQQLREELGRMRRGAAERRGAPRIPPMAGTTSRTPRPTRGVPGPGARGVGEGPTGRAEGRMPAHRGQPARGAGGGGGGEDVTPGFVFGMAWDGTGPSASPALAPTVLQFSDGTPAAAAAGAAGPGAGTGGPEAYPGAASAAAGTGADLQSFITPPVGIGQRVADGAPGSIAQTPQTPAAAAGAGTAAGVGQGAGAGLGAPMARGAREGRRVLSFATPHTGEGVQDQGVAGLGASGHTGAGGGRSVAGAGETAATGAGAGAGAGEGEEGEEEVVSLTSEQLHAKVVSALFWPPFQDEDVSLPAAVTGLLESYAQRYTAVKAPRKLEWRRNLGCVKLEVEMRGPDGAPRTEQFSVTPVQAAIVMQFQSSSAGAGANGESQEQRASGEGDGETGAGGGGGRPQWLASELAGELKLSVATLRKRIAVWVNAGVILETASQTIPVEPLYIAADSAEALESSRAAGGEAGGGALGGGDEGEEEGSMVASIEAQREEDSAVHESFVMGMLTTFDGLPLDRIHNMLKLFVTDPPYDQTVHHLQLFLQRLVSEEKVELREGLYRKR